MKAEIKSMYSPDIDDLSNYSPPDTENFCFLLQLIAGPASEKGEESFDILVCTPRWLLENLKQEDVLIGRHYLIVKEYDFNRISHKIHKFVARCEGSNWDEVASKLSRLGHWEFEDYRESEGSL
ncbi:MAG: immunity 8 family protein [Blastocatellales bacterium]|nr:immunity 8 family protein [Blastocatellales bacterium]